MATPNTPPPPEQPQQPEQPPPTEPEPEQPQQPEQPPPTEPEPEQPQQPEQPPPTEPEPEQPQQPEQPPPTEPEPEQPQQPEQPPPTEPEPEQPQQPEQPPTTEPEPEPVSPPSQPTEPETDAGIPLPQTESPISWEVVDLSAPQPADGIMYRDDEFNANWGLGAINADAAYQRGYWGQGVTVGIVDSGVHTSHHDLSANIVPGRSFDRDGNALTLGADEDTSGHGTGVAGVVGGIRGNGRFHGVAPSVGIMPLLRHTNVPAAYRYAISNNVKILNNSWEEAGTGIKGRYGDLPDTYGFKMPWTEAALALSLEYAINVRADISSVASAIGDDDIAVVFGAGNDYWNGLASSIPLCRTILNGNNCRYRPPDSDKIWRTAGEIFDNFVIHEVGVRRPPTLVTMSAPLTVTVDGAQTVLQWEASSPQPYALAPIWHPQVRGRWLAVVAVERFFGNLGGDLVLARYSNGCGDKAKYWCIAAPGSNISTALKNDDDDEAAAAANGTSMSAPHVSGALALLKSRFPDMPMSVLVHILLTTATDLGAPGVDNVYGHGLVNIARAIAVQGEVTLVMLPLGVAGQRLSGVTMVPFSITLPPPNDSDGINYRNAEFSVNWGLGAINADAAYQRGYFGQGVTVAVVGSGVRASHNNLAGNILTNAARYINASGNALTNGALDDPSTVIVTGSFTSEVTRHFGGDGTGIAGVIAGLRGNPADMTTAHGHGVAPSASILPVRFSDDVLTTVNRLGSAAIGYHLDYDAAHAAVRYAAGQNVHIINNSWSALHTYVGYYYEANVYTGKEPPNEYEDLRVTLAFEGPVFPQLLQIPGVRPDIHSDISAYAGIFRDRDIAVVWPAGDSTWNTADWVVRTYEVDDYETLVTAATPYPFGFASHELIKGFTAAVIVNGATLSLSFARGATLTINDIAVTVDAFERGGFGDYAMAPLYHPRLLGKWLAVVSHEIRADYNGNVPLSRTSNSCGSRGKYWCIAAPGVDIISAYPSDDDARHRRINALPRDAVRSGGATSFAAAHVSGALALLKSRFPDMPMSVIVNILLQTADDVGAPGVDDVYGHGLVNISAAINAQGSVSLIVPAAGGGVLLQNANTDLPSSFAGFAKRLNGVGVAAEYLDGFYYDAPLGGMIRAQSKKQKPLNFAAEMFDDDTTINEDGVFAFSRNGALRAAGWKKGAFQVRHYFHNKPSLWQSEGGDIVRRPFFADDGGYSNEVQMAVGDNLQLFAARGEEQKAEYSQMGISWRRSLSSIPKLRLAAAHSHISESDTLLGGKFGGLMPLKDGGIIRQTDIGASYALDGRWRLYGGYQRADINAKFGGIVGEMSGVMAEGWNSGFAARDWLREGDTFRIGIGKQTSISRGDMVLRINQSSNPQKDESTQAMHNRGYETTEQRISLAEEAPLFFAIGYAFTPGDNSQLAIALTHRRESPSALSINWRWDF